MWSCHEPTKSCCFIDFLLFLPFSCLCSTKISRFIILGAIWHHESKRPHCRLFLFCHSWSQKKDNWPKKMFRASWIISPTRGHYVKWVRDWSVFQFENHFINCVHFGTNRENTRIYIYMTCTFSYSTKALTKWENVYTFNKGMSQNRKVLKFQNKYSTLKCAYSESVS
jgi:hypothetical protein